MTLTSPDQAIAWERRGFSQKFLTVIPAVPSLTWLGGVYLPPPPNTPGSFYAYILTRISFGDMPPNVFWYYLFQQGQYDEVGRLNSNTLQDGLNMFLTVTRRDPVILWVLNGRIQPERFEFVFHYTVVQTEKELGEVREMVQGVLSIPPELRKKQLQ